MADRINSLLSPFCPFGSDFSSLKNGYLGNVTHIYLLIYFAGKEEVLDYLGIP